MSFILSGLRFPEQRDWLSRIFTDGRCIATELSAANLIIPILANMVTGDVVHYPLEH